MIKNEALANKIRSKHKDRGMDAFVYIANGESGLLQTANPKTSTRSNCFYLSIPGKPEIKIDNVKSYTLILHKTAATLSFGYQTNWIYFSRFHDQILEAPDLENSYFLITVQNNKMENYQKAEPFVPRFDILLYKNMELVHTFSDVLRLIINRYNFSENRIYVCRQNKETCKEEYYQYNGKYEIPFSVKTLYDRFDRLSALKAAGRDWADIPSYLDSIPFFYLFPNGKAGDIHQCIASEYGEYVLNIGDGILRTEFDISNPDPILLLDPYATKNTALAVNLTSRNQQMIDFIYTYHIPHALSAIASEIELFTGWQGLPDHMKSAKSLRAFDEKIKPKTEKIYESIVLSGNSSRRWKTEKLLFSIIKARFPDAMFQYRDKWLGRFSLDIYIPSLKTGVEYQGEQHYRQVDFFGENAYQNNLRRDDAKARICTENGVILIEWRYDKPVTESAVDELFKNRA